MIALLWGFLESSLGDDFEIYVKISLIFFLLTESVHMVLLARFDAYVEAKVGLLFLSLLFL